MPEFQDLFVYGVVGLTFLLYVALLKGMMAGYVRTYLGLFLYVIVLTLTLVLDTAMYKTAHRSAFFLVNETLRWGALYLVVLTFAWKALSTYPGRNWIRHWLIAVSILTVAVALYFSRDERTSFWVLKTVGILSVAGMMLNLILWTLLVKTRSPEIRLFLLTSGLGIQAALDAAAWTMRNLNSRPLFHAAYYVGILGHILCLIVWVMAFRRAPKQFKA